MTTLPITGQLLIGDRDETGTGDAFQAIDPQTREALPTVFTGAGEAQVDAACRLAEAAFDVYRAESSSSRAAFLDRIAAAIDALSATLIDCAMAETGLPRGRLEGERNRTTGQLRLFAAVLRSGHWQHLAVDTPLPNRQPAARSDLRQRQVPLGPVAVFGASNFPLAFSVAGGDTASALAAGCPVVAKAHPSHPGTSEWVGRALRDAVRACRLPEGVFSLVGGEGHAVGAALVAHPAIQAVGFTGSRAGGSALLRIAQQRLQPIPVFAEMSSVNPVFVLPAALKHRTESIAQGFVDSLALGSGQFCTNPGLLLGVGGTDWDRFVAAVSQALAAKPAGTMLNAGIHDAYRQGTDRLTTQAGLTRVAQGQAAAVGACAAVALVHETTATQWLATPALQEEVFGPSSLLVRCDDVAQMRRTAEHLSGQLTATLQIDPADHAQALTLLPVLKRRAGRILANGFPTGVEVGWAMVHGGPFPATSDSRSTSVGARALQRFSRPVCYQDLPDGLWPEALTGSALAASWRVVDGALLGPAAAA